MADNTLALLQYLSSSASPTPSLTGGYTKPTTVFFSFLNTFFLQYNFQTANAMHVVLFASTVLFIIATYEPMRKPTSSKSQSNGAYTQNENTPSQSKVAVEVEDNLWVEYIKGMGILTASVVGSLFGVCFVAFIMAVVLNRPLSWFRIEYSCLVLYVPAALTGKVMLFEPQYNLIMLCDDLRRLIAANMARKTYARTSFVERRSSVSQSLSLIDPGGWHRLWWNFLPDRDAYVRRTSSEKTGDRIRRWRLAGHLCVRSNSSHLFWYRSIFRYSRFLCPVGKINRCLEYTFQNVDFICSPRLAEWEL